MNNLNFFFLNLKKKIKNNLKKYFNYKINLFNKKKINTSKLKKIRKNIAKIKTILNFYKKK